MCLFFLKNNYVCLLKEALNIIIIPKHDHLLIYFVNDLVHYHHGEENGIIQAEMMINT